VIVAFAIATPPAWSISEPEIETAACVCALAATAIDATIDVTKLSAQTSDAKRVWIGIVPQLVSICNDLTL